MEIQVMVIEEIRSRQMLWSHIGSACQIFEAVNSKLSQNNLTRELQNNISKQIFLVRAKIIW